MDEPKITSIKPTIGDDPIEEWDDGKNHHIIYFDFIAQEHRHYIGPSEQNDDDDREEDEETREENDEINESDEENENLDESEGDDSLEENDENPETEGGERPEDIGKNTGEGAEEATGGLSEGVEAAEGLASTGEGLSAGAGGVAAEGGAATAAAAPEAGAIALGLAAVVTIFVISTLVIMAFMGASPDSAYGDTIGGSATIRDGERDTLAKEVVDHPNISAQSEINFIDINPDTCYTAPISWDGEKCVQKPVLQFLLALADAGIEVQISSTIRDHPPSINPTSRHLDGMAVDIGNDEIFLDTMKWVTSNLLDTKIAPRQVLCAGADNIYGTGVIVPEIDNLSVDDGKIFPEFTSKYVGDHTGHIHIGY